VNGWPLTLFAANAWEHRMPDTEQDPIIITGRFGGSFFGSYGFNPADFQSGIGSFYVGGLTLASYYAANPKHLKLPGTANKPATQTNNLNKDQLAAVLSSLDNADKDAGLSSSFKEMAEKGVKMTVTVQAAVPDWFEDPSFQVAGVRFSGTDTNADGKADSFSSNSTVEIVIVAGRFNGISGFKSHLAHELTHLIRGSSGNFLSESGVQQRESQTYDNIFAGLNMDDYAESMDYAVAMPGNQTNYYGTNGNNQFTDPGSYNQIYTASGNDIVQSGDYSDLVVVNGAGLKFVIDYGSGWDVLEAQTIATMADVVWTRIGLDLYITNRLAGVGPTDDPNAIILLDWYAMLPYGHIDYLKTADGDMIVLVDVAGQGVPAGAPMASSPDDSSLQSSTAGPEPLGGGPQALHSTAARYEGILSYTSYAVDPGQILSSREAVEVMQLIHSRPSDSVEPFLGAQPVDGDFDLPLGLAVPLQPLNSPEAVFG
jgi:hypothetical protein